MSPEIEIHQLHYSSVPFVCFWGHRRLESTSCFFRFSEFFSQNSNEIISLGILQNFWSELEFWINLTNTTWEKTPRNEFLTKPRNPESPSNRTHEMFVKFLQNSPFDQKMISKTLKIWFCNTQVASAATEAQLNS